MDNPHGERQIAARLKKQRLFTWPVVLLMLALLPLLGFAIWQNEQMARFPSITSQAYQDALNASLQMVEDFNQQVHYAEKKKNGKLNLADAQTLFPNYVFKIRAPFEITWPDGRIVLKAEGVVEEPTKGVKISVYFLDGHVAGYGTIAVPKQWPTKPPYWELTRELRKRVYEYSVGLWSIGILPAPFLWHRFGPVRVARYLLMISFVWLAAGLSEFNRSQKHFGIGSVNGVWPGLAVLVSIAVARSACRQVRDPRYCVSCGYDLTANISGVCPECGTPVPLPDAPPTHGPLTARPIQDILESIRKD